MLISILAKSFEGRGREIVTRVLRDYGTPLQTTLERLSVARRFDRRAFAHVVQTFSTGLAIDQFDRIAELPFVTQSEDGFLTIHNAIASASGRGRFIPHRPAAKIAEIEREVSGEP